MPKSLAEHLSAVRRAIPVGDHDAQANAMAPIDDHVDLTDYRPITPQEKALLTAMLHSNDPAALAFLPQLKMATAISAKGATRYWPGPKAQEYQPPNKRAQSTTPAGGHTKPRATTLSAKGATRY